MMNPLAIVAAVIATTVVATIGILVLFALVATVVNRLERKNGYLAKAIIIPFVFVDWVYNWTFGSILGWEFPHTWHELATKRLKRYVRTIPPTAKGIRWWRLRLAIFIGRILNSFDEGHM